MKQFGIILFILSLFPLINLLTPGMMDAHDAPDHVARIANFYQSLSEGIPVPRWAGNLNWGYGHPILMFLYPMSSYVASFFHFLGVGFVDSVKLVFAVSYMASILTFFLWAGLAFSPVAGFVGAVLYGFAPYRFVDLYVRGAIGEHVAFVFIPVILLGLWAHAMEKRWAHWSLTLGVAGLLLSHNAVSLMVLPVAFLYALYLYAFEAKKRRTFIVYSLLFTFFGFLLSAFFWMPALFEGKYTLRDIVTKGEYASRFVPFAKFFYSPWNWGISNEFTKQLGVAQWFVVAAGLFLIVKTKLKKYRALFFGGLAILIVSLFVQTAGSLALWNAISILQNFQFPWRFLTVSVLVTSAMGSFAILLLPKKLHYIGWIIVGVAVISSLSMWRAKSYTVRPESYYRGIYDSTTDTGESSPIWSVRFMERRAETPMQVIEGKADISATERTTTLHEYAITAQEKSRLVENTLYFPGWLVLVDGAAVPVEFQDSRFRGLMTFWIEPGDYVVQITFGDTKLRKASNMISLVGLSVIILAGTIQLWPRKKRS